MSTTNDTAVIKWVYRNKDNPNDIISEAQFEDMFDRGDERVKNYEGVRARIRQQQPQQSGEDHLYKGTLNEVTVTPNGTYNSDIKNLPALETTNTSTYDDIRKRFKASVEQQRRQAAPSAQEQLQRHQEAIANMPDDKRREWEQDKQFAKYVRNFAGGVTAMPAIMPAIGHAGAWLINNAGLVSQALNPATYVDKLASALGFSTGYSGFGASTIPGMLTNAYLGTKAGYEAYKDLRYNPNKTWQNGVWDALGLTAGLATGLEAGSATLPTASRLYGRAMVGADTFRDYFTGRKNANELIDIINKEFGIFNEANGTGYKPLINRKSLSTQPITFRRFLTRLYGKENGEAFYRTLRNTNSNKLAQLEQQYAQALDYATTSNLRRGFQEWMGGGLGAPEDEGVFDITAYQDWLNSAIGKRQVATLNRGLAKLNPNYGEMLKRQYGNRSPIAYNTILNNIVSSRRLGNTNLLNDIDKPALRSAQLQYLRSLKDLDRVLINNQRIELARDYLPKKLSNFTLGHPFSVITATRDEDSVINLGKAKNKDIKKFYDRYLREHGITDVDITIQPDGNVVAKAKYPVDYRIWDETRLQGNMPIWNGVEQGQAPLAPYNITVSNTDNQIIDKAIASVLNLRTGQLTGVNSDDVIQYGNLSIPTTAKDNIGKFVQGVIDLLGVPGHPEYNAKLMGSVSLFLENGLASAPHDIDLITTTTRINNCFTLKNALKGVPYDSKGYTRNITVGMNNSSTGIKGGNHESSNVFGKMGVLDINEIKTDANDNILTGIDPKTGKHINELAVELYRQLFPEDFNRELQNAWLSRPKGEWFNEVNPNFPIQFTHLDPKTGQIVPLKGEDLMNAYDPVTKGVIDALEIDFTRTNKEKHKNRIFQFMQWGPAESVSRGIRAFARSRLGSYYNPPMDLAKAGLFNDAKANEQMLSAMGYHFGTPSDPQRMQNAFELWYLDATMKYRGISPQRFKNPGALDSPQNFMLNLISSANKWYYGQLTGTYEGNGYANGVGLNTASAQTQYGDIGMFVQLPVNFNGVKSPSDAITAVQRATGTNYKFTENDLKNMPITATLIKAGESSNDLLRAATAHFDNIRKANNGNTLEAGKWFEEWQRELKANGIAGLTDPEGNFTQNNAYTSIVNDIAGNRIQGALKTNASGQGLSRDLPTRNQINDFANSPLNGMAQTSFLPNYEGDLYGHMLLPYEITYSYGTLVAPLIRKNYSPKIISTVKDYYHSDLYKEVGQFYGTDAVVPSKLTLLQRITKLSTEKPLYGQLIDKYGTEEGKKVIHLINVNTINTILNRNNMQDTEVSIEKLKSNTHLASAMFSKAQNDYQLFLDKGYTPQEIEDAVTIHNELFRQQPAKDAMIQFHLNRGIFKVSPSTVRGYKFRVKEAKENLQKAHENYNLTLEGVKRTSPYSTEVSEALKRTEENIAARNNRVNKAIQKLDNGRIRTWNAIIGYKAGGTLLQYIQN